LIKKFFTAVKKKTKIILNYYKEMIKKSVLSMILFNAMLGGIGVVMDKKSTIGAKSSDFSLAFFSQITQAFFVAIVIIIWTRNTLWKDFDLKRPEYKWLTLSSLAFTIPFVTFYWIYRREKAHVITLFTVGFATIFGVLMPALLLKEKVATATWVGMSIVLIGLLVINYYHGRESGPPVAFTHVY